MMIAVIFAIFVILPSIISFLCKLLWDQEDKKNGITGPSVLPIFGNIFDVSKAAAEYKTFRWFEKLEREYGPTFRVRMFNITFILSSDIRVMEALNNANVPKADSYRFLEPWLGKSMVLTYGERWMQLRRIATPAFHFQILEDFIPVFEEQASILIERIKKAATGVTVDIVPYLGAYTLDVIMETAMGIHVGAQTKQESEFLDAIKQILALVSRRSLNPLYYPDLIWKLSSKGRRHDHCLKIIHRFVGNVIEERRNYLIQLNAEESNGKVNIKKKRMALLDTLLHSTINGQPLTNSDIQGEVNQFTFAAHDTTKASLSFILYQLAKHSEVQQKLYDEIYEEIHLKNKGQLNISIINSLRYLDLCLKESLRILPPVPIVGKKNLEKLEIDDLTIPANSTIFLMIMANHLNPQNFPDPQKFVPERFIEETSIEQRHPFIYAPFSVGLRNCVGQKFAILNIKTAVIKLLLNFRIELETEDYVMDVISEGVLKPKDGLPLKFLPRTNE